MAAASAAAAVPSAAVAAAAETESNLPHVLPKAAAAVATVPAESEQEQEDVGVGVREPTSTSGITQARIQGMEKLTAYERVKRWKLENGKSPLGRYSAPVGGSSDHVGKKKRR